MKREILDYLRRFSFVMMLFAMVFAVACEEDTIADDTDVDSDGVVDDDDLSDDSDDDSNDDSGDDEPSTLILESFIVSLSTGEKLLTVVDNDARTITIEGVSSSQLIDDVIYTTNETAFLSPPIDTILELWTWGSGTTFTFWDTKTFVDYEVTLVDYDRGEDNVLTVSLAEENVKQQVQFIGCDMERSQSFLQSASNKEEVARWVFEDIDFNVCRCSYDKKQELVQGTKNLDTFYANCLATMHLIREVNPNVEFWATMKSDYNGYNNQNNLPDWIYDYDGGTYFYTTYYAGFLFDYLEHMHKNGITIKYLSTAKEWSGVVTIARAKATIEALIPMLEEAGVPIPLFNDCEAWSTQGGYNYVNSTISAGCEDYYWGFSTHNYNSTGHKYTYGDMIDLAGTITKSKRADIMEYWGEDVNAPYYCIQSETGGAVLGAVSGVDSAVSLPVGQFADKCNFFGYGMHGELMFEVWSRNVASETRAIYFTSSKPQATRMSNYYIIQSHGNFFQDGMYYLGSEHTNITISSDEFYSMQFANEDQMYICVVNTGTDVIDNLLITLDDETLYGDVRRHVMDEETVKTNGVLSGKYYDTALLAGEFEVDIPAMSINFFKIDLTEKR